MKRKGERRGITLKFVYLARQGRGTERTFLNYFNILSMNKNNKAFRIKRPFIKLLK